MTGTPLDALRDEVASLRGDVADLLAEVGRLRAALATGQQIHHHYPPFAPAPQPVPWNPVPPVRWTTNVCAGVPSVQTYMVNTTCAGPAMIPAPVYTQGAAGCNPAITTLMINTGGAN